MEFSASERLAVHFRRRPQCLRTVSSFLPAPIVRTEEEVQMAAHRRAEMKNIGRTDRFAEVPAYRLPGPFLPRAIRAQNGENGGQERGEVQDPTGFGQPGIQGVVVVEDSD